MLPALIAHGGAGADPEDREVYRHALRDALRAGWTRLRAGGSALDAVEACVAVLEAHPQLNAGYGSALTETGTVECDASIMEGERLAAGAVGAVSGVVSPIGLARRVLEEGRHVLLVGDGALAFARQAGIPECDPAELITERQRTRYLERVARGTVGAVALDLHGTIAAATSTGGTAGKLPGRVGDSALIGCGTYAESTIGGVSCTGDGEAIIRVVLGRRALDILKALDEPEHAAQVAVDVLVQEGGGQGGLVLLDWRGRVGWAHSTPLMPVGWISPAQPGPVLPF